MSLDSNYSDNFKQENSRTDLTSSGLQVNTNALSSSHSAVSWGAILAGTVAAAALSLILIILGAGFGMSSISVWSGQGISATTFGFTTIVWLAFTQIIAYGMGGYLAGRLRTKWVSVHTDEVYFRDTAHGFLTWALASLLCATLLASAIGAIVGGAAKVGTSLAGGAASAVVSGAASHMDTSAMKTSMGSASMGSESRGSDSSTANPMNYLIGTLFRKDGIDVNSVATDNRQGNVNTNSTESETSSNFAAAEANTNSNDMSGNNATDNNTNSADSNRNNQTAEVASIFVNNMNAATLPASDVKYVGQLVSQQAGISQQEAEKRVAVTFAQMQQQKINAISQAKDAADKALSATAYAALWGFVFLLVGAFSASLAATWGGRSRDN